MKKLFIATGIIGIASMVNLITGLIRAKFTALTLGPEGVGIFSQASNFIQFLTSFGALGIGVGVNRYIAQYWKEKNIGNTHKTILFAFFLIFSLSFLIIFMALFAAPQISQFLFSDRDYGIYVLMLAVSLPFVVSSSLFSDIFFGFEKIKLFTKARVISLIAGLIFLFIFVHLFRLKGAFIYLVMSGTFMGIVFFYFAYRELPREIIECFFKKTVIKLKEILYWCKKLLNYGAVILLSTILSLFTILYLRAALIRQFGPESNGIYQVVFAISGYYLPFLTNGLWGYFYPRMSAFKEKKQFITEINNTFRLLIIIIVPSIIALYIFRDLLIKLVFSSEFLSASHLFSWQLSGDFFFLLLYILNTSLLARTFLKEYLFIGIGYNISFILIFISSYRTLGIKAIVISYLLSSGIFFIVNFIMHKNKIGFKLYSENLKLIILSLILLIVCMNIKDSHLFNFFKIALTAGWFLLIAKKEEIQKVKLLFASGYTRFTS